MSSEFSWGPGHPKGAAKRPSSANKYCNRTHKQSSATSHCRALLPRFQASHLAALAIHCPQAGREVLGPGLLAGASKKRLRGAKCRVPRYSDLGRISLLSSSQLTSRCCLGPRWPNGHGSLLSQRDRERERESGRKLRGPILKVMGYGVVARRRSACSPECATMSLPHHNSQDQP